MQLIAPEILQEAGEISPPVIIVIGIMGLMLFVFGWRWHRFWIGMSITIAGGLIGLYSGKALGSNILALGILLAIAAGALAMELARILAFLIAGMSLWSIALRIFPGGQELWITFLFGGLIGLWLYRVWMMFLTSFAGLLVTVHCLLVSWHQYLNADTFSIVEEKPSLFNLSIIAAAIVGVFLQSGLERWERNRQKQAKIDNETKIREEERKKVLAEIPAPEPKKNSWWQFRSHSEK